MSGRKGISPFSVLLVTAVLVIAGLASASRLKVQFSPSAPAKSITVSFSMAESSPYVVETKATAIIEGALSRLASVKSSSSVSYEGSGSVTVTFDKNVDIARARLDVSSAIRNIYESLPESVSYPSISLSASGEKSRTAISYTLKGAMPSAELEQFALDHLYAPLASVDGVDKVSVSGGTPYQWVVTFDSQLVEHLGISATDISSAVSSYFRESFVGAVSDGESVINVRMSGSGEGRVSSDRTSAVLAEIPVKNVGGRVVKLGDIAGFTFKESIPDSYYRVNGLNTVSISIGAVSDGSLLQTVSAVRQKMAGLEPIFPDSVSASVSYDSTTYIRGEIDKIIKRTLLCLLILLLFVMLTSRSLRYTLLMSLTLLVNISVALAFYALLGIRIHIYSLAGITVSLGIIIDSTIIMVDHYARHRDRKAFPALLSAVLTTIAALMVILLLPEKDKAVLTDFVYVIAVNLTVSLLVAYFFVPAFLETIGFETAGTLAAPRRRLRRAARWNRFYGSYIKWACAHKWVPTIALVIAFGIPLCLLPEPRKNIDDPNIFQRSYAWIMNNSPYGKNRARIDDIVGTSFAAFDRATSHTNFFREPSERVLYIHASMPEGCSISQLNDVVKCMENYLAMFDEISVYMTSISSSTSADIEVRFKPEYENTSFPDLLKSEVTSMAINFGGANWRISGVNDSYFNNNVSVLYRSSVITLKGYNYSALEDYADTVLAILDGNPRVNSPIVQGGRRDETGTQYSLEYDFETMTRMGVSPYKYYGILRSPLYDNSMVSLVSAGKNVPVVLQSDRKDSLDLWHMENTSMHVGSTLSYAGNSSMNVGNASSNTGSALSAGDGVNVKFSDVGSLVKKRTGFPIRKSNQSYEVNICYDFIGSYTLESKLARSVISHLNQDVLPVGFKASSPNYGGFSEEKDKYLSLVLLVVLVIFVICSICFESLRLPLAVISLIPVSFIGLFLLFGLTEFPFDQGGFAAMVMLCGISVNAGIYLIFQYRDILSRTGANPDSPGSDARNGKSSRFAECSVTPTSVHCYLKSFNIKILPILLTILSTVLGLVPFLFEGPGEVFWFDFAAGTIVGMAFSIIAIVFYLPAYLFRRP